jgi:hypothetical protein
MLKGGNRMKKLFYVTALAALCVWVLPGCLVTDYSGTYDNKTQGLARINAGAEVYTYADTCDTTIPGDTFANGMTGIMYTEYQRDHYRSDYSCPSAGIALECDEALDNPGPDHDPNYPQGSHYNQCLQWVQKGIKHQFISGTSGGGGGDKSPNFYGYACELKDLDGDGDLDGTVAVPVYNDIMGNHPDMYYDWYEGYANGDLYCWDAVGGWWGLFTDDRPEFWTWNTPLWDNPNSTSPFSWTCPADMPPRTRDKSQRSTTLVCETEPSEFWWGQYCYSYWGYWYSPPRWYSYCYDTRFTKSNCGWGANVVATEEANLDWLPPDQYGNSWDPNTQTLGPGNRAWADLSIPMDDVDMDFACPYDGTGAATCFYAMTAEIDDHICDFGMPMDKLFEAVRNASVTENGMVAMEVTGFRLGDKEVVFSEPYTLKIPPDMNNVKIPLSLQDAWLKQAAAEILDSGATMGEPTIFVNGVELSIPAVVTLNPNWLEARAGAGKDVVRNR